MRKIFLLILLLTAVPASAGTSFKWNGPLLDYAAQLYLNGAAGKVSDVDCMSKVIFFEARGEKPAGKIMVANVVHNRTQFGKPFANTICGVVYQKGQFSWTKNKWKRNTDFQSVALKFNKKEHESVKESLKIALYFVLFEPKNTGKCTHFSSKSDKFGRTLYIKQVGNHKFYQYLGNK